MLEIITATLDSWINLSSCCGQLDYLQLLSVTQCQYPFCKKSCMRPIGHVGFMHVGPTCHWTHGTNMSLKHWSYEILSPILPPHILSLDCCIDKSFGPVYTVAASFNIVCSVVPITQRITGNIIPPLLNSMSSFKFFILTKGSLEFSQLTPIDSQICWRNEIQWFWAWIHANSLLKTYQLLQVFLPSSSSSVQNIQYILNK